MRYIAFLRAINVGGHTVTMARLRELFVGLGLEDVSTFIASGNVLFTSRARGVGALETRIESTLQSALGFEVATLIRRAEDVRTVAAFEPFEGSAPEGATDFVGFLRRVPTDDATARLMRLSNAIDALRVHGRELYWRRHGPGPASKLTGAVIERTLGMEATLRNINTVRKLAALP